MSSRTPQPSHAPDDRHTYIPPHIQQALARQMEQTVPPNMRQYVEPFLQQGGGMTNSHSGSPEAPHRTAPHPMAALNMGVGHPTGVSPLQRPQGNPLQYQPEQPPAAPQPTATPQSPPTPGNGPQASYAAPPAPSNDPAASYDFIMSNAPGANRATSLPKVPGASSGVLKRVLLVMGGIMVLFIIFAVLKSTILNTTPNNKQALLSIVQSQQSIIQLSTAALLEKSLSTPNKNFSITAELSLISDQAKLITYMRDAAIMKKIPPKVQSLKVNPKNDEELATAATEDTYNTTYVTIMKNQLGEYQLALKSAYSKTPGKKGRQILTDTFNEAQLLSQQLTAGAPATP